MREQLAGERHGLGPLEVGVPRERDPLGAGGTSAEGLAQIEQQTGDLVDPPTRVQPQGGRHLVVAAPRRVELGTGLAGELGDAPFDRRVDVLVTRGELEPSGGELRPNLVERREQLGHVDVVEDARVSETPHVRDRTVEVVAPELPVERDALGERHHRLGGRRLHPFRPERHGQPSPASAAACRLAQVLMPKP